MSSREDQVCHKRRIRRDPRSKERDKRIRRERQTSEEGSCISGGTFHEDGTCFGESPLNHGTYYWPDQD